MVLLAGYDGRDIARIGMGCFTSQLIDFLKIIHRC